MADKEVLINGGYCMEVSGYDGKKVLWELADNNVVEEGKEHDKI